MQAQEQTFAANRADSRIALTVKATLGATRRDSVSEQGSLRVRCPGPIGPELEAVAVNTAGGVAGGDRLQIDVGVGSGAALVMTSVAAEKVYRTTGAEAAIGVRLQVAAGARLAWLPQETILFDRAAFRRTIEVDLHESAELLLAEGLVFGRAEMGERVRHGRLFDRWRIRRGGRLLYAEANRLEGHIAARLQDRAVAKGGIAVATLLVAPGDQAVAERVRDVTSGCRGEVGASAWNGIAVARFCAGDGASLRHDMVRVLTELRDRPLPRLWMH